MGRKSLEKQINNKYNSMGRYGVSKFETKNQIAAENNKSRFETKSPYIHSRTTMATYKRVGDRFADYLIEKENFKKYDDFKDITIDHAINYLKYRYDHDLVSPFTLKMERSALSKLLDKKIEVELPQREREDIFRSRNEVDNDRHFSLKNNHDLIVIAKACGFRRSDLEKVHIRDFKERDGHLYVSIDKSKGGRSRTSPVLPKYEKEVKEIIRERENLGKEKLVDKVHSKMDVHSYRREYAQELYQQVKEDHKLRDEYLNQYKQRNENIKSDYYHSRGDVEFHGLRDDIYVVSQALGHNRLDVSVNHYLK